MKSFLGYLPLCALFVAFSYGQGPQPASIAANAGPGIITRHDIRHDVSQPLRELAKNPPALKPEPHEAEPVKVIPLPSGFKPANEPDTVLQKPTMVGELAPALGATMGLNFEGLGTGFPSYSVNVAPPDTNGAVGLTQYVQWVNLSFAVFDKTTGKVTLGPVAGNTLWAGFGGGCETENDGDPIVTYDKLANRWVFSQFVVRSGPFLQCVAVSTTSDATGSYNRYSFEYTDFDDYPKMGVWPDAYYITFNMFSGGVFFVGADACAYDRNAMLNGLPAAQICFQQAVGSLLPADLDGQFAPPAGAPNYMMDFGVNSLNLYKFHVDFNNPANSTFTGPVNIPVAPFSPFCPAVTGCVPQPGGNGTRLDSLGDRLMYRLAYRNFGDHESLVVNHSVDPGSQNSGIRWYEIQNPNAATPLVAQQSTFSPDTTSYRWMGSIAMDVNGDIAVGYSVINSTPAAPLFASAAIAARAATDLPSTLQQETLIVTGGGAQLGGLTRWGDYSAMQVDPADDCTFWYTTEYLQNTGAFNWNTRIANFKFPGCGFPDLSITLRHTGNFTEGQTTAAYTITVANIGGQPTDGAAVTVADILPAGLSATAINSKDANWNCSLVSLSCTRSDALAPGASFPAITVTVSVAANAPGLVANTATVSGGGDKNPSNNTATDPTTIIVNGPDPTITKSHGPSFPRGQSGAYTITVTNEGLAPTDPTQPLTVTDTLPAGLTAVSAGGAGWGTCAVGPPVTCTRSDSLPSNQSYPPIAIVVSVAADAPPVVTNSASVAGGGDANPFNNSASDPTGIVDQPPGMAITNPVPSPVLSGATEFKPGTQIPIIGTATAPTFQDFRMQWAEGNNPTTGWSSSGITLAGGGSSPVTNGPLGTWDTSGITAADYYTLRLLVDSAGFTNQVATIVYLEPSLLSVHWPVILRVSPELNSGFLPAVDAAGKQRLVLVAPVYGQTGAIPAQYFSFVPDASSQTVIDITQPSYNNPAVGTVEGTPGDEVVIPDLVASGSDQGQMEFFRPDNTSFTFQLPAGFANNVFTFNQPVLEDVEGKGQLDVVNTVDSFVHGFGVDPASVFAWRPDGSLLGSHFPIAVPDKSTDTEFSLHPRVFVADLQGNGSKEFIAEAGLSSTSFTLQLFAQDGTAIPWAVPVFGGRPLDLALADLDHNGKLETLLLMVDTNLSAALHVFQPDGSERPGFPVSAGNAGEGHIAVGDLNRDGTEEIVVLPRNNNLMVLEPDGTAFPGNWSGLVPTGTFLSGPLAVADVDGDGFPEILLTEYHLVGLAPAGPADVPGQDGRATVQTAQSPEGLLSLSVTAATSSSQPTAPQYWTVALMAVRRDSTIVRTWNLPGANGNQPHSEAKITVGDFDQDGITDIAVNNFIIDGGGINGVLTGGIAMVLTTGAQFNAAANDWPMLHHDPHNTAVLRRDVTLSVTAPASGASVSGTVQVTASAAGPVASIQFKLDGANLGPALLAAPFAVSWDTTQVTIGPHKIVAMATDNHGQLIASAPVSVNVTAAPKTATNVSITLIAGTNPAKFGDTLSFAANVTPNAATGTVIVFDGTTAISGSLPLHAGSATFTTSSLAAGTHSLTAQYSGDSNFMASTSPAFIQNVMAPTNVSIALSAGTNPAKFGDTLSFAANVTPPAATGTVIIFDGATAISGSLPLHAGSATFTTSSLAGGTHSLTAQYSGDSNFIASTSPAFIQNVMDFNVVASPQSASISAGSSASFSFTVTPLGGFNQIVTFSCSGLPALAGCSFAPATVTPNGSAVTSVLTVTTTASSAAFRPPSGPENGLPLYASLLGALGTAWLALGRRRKQSMRTARLGLGLAALCLAVVVATSCGGSAGNPAPRPGTPPGTSQIVVTMSAANASKTMTVTLVVH